MERTAILLAAFLLLAGCTGPLGSGDVQTTTEEPIETGYESVETTLAHEYEHVIQTALVGDRDVPDSVEEGTAVYVEDAYAERYLDGVDPSAERRAAYEGAKANAWKYLKAEYHLGYRYVDASVDSPENLSTMYEDVPTTGEQILHGLSPEQEPPANLTVTPDGSAWAQTGPLGETFLRVALTEHLNGSAATTAAAGWGNDTLLVHGWEKQSFVWVIRMDDPENASELETALNQHLDGIATRDGEQWRSNDAAYRLIRADDETLAVAVGNRTFVGNVSISSSDDAMTVSV